MGKQWADQAKQRDRARKAKRKRQQQQANAARRDMITHPGRWLWQKFWYS